MGQAPTANLHILSQSAFNRAAVRPGDRYRNRFAGADLIEGGLMGNSLILWDDIEHDEAINLFKF